MHETVKEFSKKTRRNSHLEVKLGLDSGGESVVDRLVKLNQHSKHKSNYYRISTLEESASTLNKKIGSSDLSVNNKALSRSKRNYKCFEHSYKGRGWKYHNL